MSDNGHLVPSAEILESTATRDRRRGGAEPNSAHVPLDGNVARRAVADREFIYWDTELPGFGLRTFPSGAKSWFLQFRQLGTQKRVTLGKVGKTTAEAARAAARARFASVALDGLPSPQPARKPSRAISFREYAPQFWEDYARHWKPTTRDRNHSAIFKELVSIFGRQSVGAIPRADILRWRDGCGERQGAFNRTIPVMSVMISYAKPLGLRPRGSNPYKGTPRYKRQPVERFLSAREFGRLPGFGIRHYASGRSIYIVQAAMAGVTRTVTLGSTKVLTSRMFDPIAYITKAEANYFAAIDQLDMAA